MNTKGKLIDISLMAHKLTLTFQVEARPEDMEKYKEKYLDISFGFHREKRSLDANACLWGCLGKIADKIGMDNWSVYLYMLERYGKYTYVVVKPEAVDDLRRQWRETKVVGDTMIDGIPMKQVLCFYGSSTYNSKEFSRLLDGVITDMQDLGLEPPLRADIRAMLEGMDNDRQGENSKPDSL